MNPFKKLNSIKRQQLQNFDFKKDADRMRNTQKWKDNRQELISDTDSCEWCGESADTYQIHHTWGESFGRQWIKATDEGFVQSDSYKDSYTENREECPNCGKRSYYERKTKTPTYRCRSCNTQFSEPAIVDGKDAVVNENLPTKPYVKDVYHKKKVQWVDKNRDEVMELFQHRYDALMETYADLKDDQVVVICNSCHYKEEKTDLRLCERCEENWYNPQSVRDNMCWDCIVEENGLEKCPDCGENWYQPSKNSACSDCR